MTALTGPPVAATTDRLLKPQPPAAVQVCSWNAIWVPSGDQTGPKAAPGTFVTFVGEVPSRFATTICALPGPPSRVLYAIFLPSGEKLTDSASVTVATLEVAGSKTE